MYNITLCFTTHLIYALYIAFSQFFLTIPTIKVYLVITLWSPLLARQRVTEETTTMVHECYSLVSNRQISLVIPLYVYEKVAIPAGALSLNCD